MLRSENDIGLINFIFISLGVAHLNFGPTLEIQIMKESRSRKS
jgi:hypothetical protein